MSLSKSGYQGTNFYRMEKGVLERKYHKETSPFNVEWFPVNEHGTPLPSKVVQYQIDRVPQKVHPDAFMVEILVSHELLRKELDTLKELLNG